MINVIKSYRKKPFTRIFVFIYFSIFLGACTTYSQQPELTDNVKELINIDAQSNVFPRLIDDPFSSSIAIPTKDEIYALSSKQIQEFEHFAKSIEQQNQLTYQQLYRYLQSISHEFKYADETLDARTTLEEKRGNCMSLAVLTAALANRFNVDIRYQMVHRLPVYQEYNNIIFNAKHIRSVLYPSVADIQSSDSTPLIKARAVVDYYPSPFSYVSGNVDENGLLGKYFRNLSAEALSKKDYSRSYYLLKASLQYEPKHEESINNLAILYRRVGMPDKAEEFYRYGIKHAKNRLTLLKNYRAFLKSQNRDSEVIILEEELKNYHDPDPFPWVHSANDAFDQADYHLALTHYDRAIELAPYLHQAHFGRSKSLYMLGKINSAELAMERAQNEAYDQRSKDLYASKLAVLRNSL